MDVSFVDLFFKDVMCVVLCREWEIEKMKLENCIHIQQMELEERTLAAEEKAAVIVKVYKIRYVAPWFVVVVEVLVLCIDVLYVLC